MTQRDRLAAVILEAVAGEVDPPLWETVDKLLARGVRVVDADTLARAITEAAPAGPGIRAEAAAIIAALDDVGDAVAELEFLKPIR